MKKYILLSGVAACMCATSVMAADYVDIYDTRGSRLPKERVDLYEEIASNSAKAEYTSGTEYGENSIGSTLNTLTGTGDRSVNKALEDAKSYTDSAITTAITNDIENKTVILSGDKGTTSQSVYDTDGTAQYVTDNAKDAKYDDTSTIAEAIQQNISDITNIVDGTTQISLNADTANIEGATNIAQKDIANSQSNDVIYSLEVTSDYIKANSVITANEGMTFGEDETLIKGLEEHEISAHPQNEAVAKLTSVSAVQETRAAINTDMYNVVGDSFYISGVDSSVSYDNTPFETSTPNGFEKGATSLTDGLVKYADNVKDAM